jgi:hypothetical protein
MELELNLFGPDAASVEFPLSLLPAVLHRLQARGGKFSRSAAIDGEILMVGTVRLFLANDLDGVSLLAKDKAGVELLAALASRRSQPAVTAAQPGGRLAAAPERRSERRAANAPSSAAGR